jgi:hypothetical protein
MTEERICQKAIPVCPGLEERKRKESGNPEKQPERLLEKLEMLVERGAMFQTLHLEMVVRTNNSSIDRRSRIKIPM